MIFVLQRLRRILCGDHDFMQLLAGTNACLNRPAAGEHGLGQILDIETWNFADEGLSAMGLAKRLDHKLHALLQADPEAGHPVVCDRKRRLSLFNQAVEEGDDGAAAARHIAIPHDGERDISRACIGVGRDEQLVRYQLGAAVQVHRIDRLVRRQRHNPGYLRVEAGVDDIHRTVDIGLDRLSGVVFTGGNLLERRRVDDIVHTAAQCPRQSLPVAHIADKIAHLLRVLSEEGIVAHDELFEFIPGIDDDLLRMIVRQNVPGKAFAKGTGPTGDQDCFAVNDICHKSSKGMLFW